MKMTEVLVSVKLKPFPSTLDTFYVNNERFLGADS